MTRFFIAIFIIVIFIAVVSKSDNSYSLDEVYTLIGQEDKVKLQELIDNEAIVSFNTEYSEFYPRITNDDFLVPLTVFVENGEININKMLAFNHFITVMSLDIRPKELLGDSEGIQISIPEIIPNDFPYATETSTLVGSNPFLNVLGFGQLGLTLEEFKFAETILNSDISKTLNKGLKSDIQEQVSIFTDSVQGLLFLMVAESLEEYNEVSATQRLGALKLIFNNYDSLVDNVYFEEIILSYSKDQLSTIIERFESHHEKVLNLEKHIQEFIVSHSSPMQQKQHNTCFIIVPNNVVANYNVVGKFEITYDSYKVQPYFCN